MKRIASFLLALIIVIASLSSCGEKKYKPVASTSEEARVVMKLSLEDEVYEVKYELYRALFLDFKSKVDGGDSSVWSGDNKAEYIEKINNLIIGRAAEIYGTFHVCKKIGIDVYGKEFDKQVESAIKVSVDGGIAADGSKIEGFGGSYKKFLEFLKSMNLNYSVCDLMIRYSHATAKIDTYYKGNINEDGFSGKPVIGAIKYTEEDVRAFYESDECVRVIRAFLPSRYYSDTRAMEIRNEMAKKGEYGETTLVNYIIPFLTVGGTSIENGELIAKNNLDHYYYSELVTTAFEMEYFTTSHPMRITTSRDDGNHIIFKTTKSEDYFTKCYNDVANVYLDNEIGKILNSATSALADSAEPTSVLDSIDYSRINME